MAIDTVDISQYIGIRSAESSYSTSCSTKGSGSSKAYSRKLKTDKHVQSPYLITGSSEVLPKQIEKKSMNRKELVSSAKSQKNNSQNSSAKKQKKSVLTLPNAKTPTPNEWTVSDNNDCYYSPEEHKEHMDQKARRIAYNGRNKQRNINDYFLNSETDISTVSTVVERKKRVVLKKEANNKNDLSNVWSLLKNMNNLQFQTSPTISLVGEVTTRERYKKRCRSSRNARKQNRVLKSCETEELIYISINNIKSKDSIVKKMPSTEDIYINKDSHCINKIKMNETKRLKHQKPIIEKSINETRIKEASNIANTHRVPATIKEKFNDGKNNKTKLIVPITSCNYPNQIYLKSETPIENGDYYKTFSKVENNEAVVEDLPKNNRIHNNNKLAKTSRTFQSSNKLNSMKENLNNNQSIELFQNQIKSYKHQNSEKQYLSRKSAMTIHNGDNLTNNNIYDQKIIKEFLKQRRCFDNLDVIGNRENQFDEPINHTKSLLENNDDLELNENHPRIKSAKEKEFNSNIKLPNNHSKSVRYSSCNIQTVSPMTKNQKDALLENNLEKKYENDNLCVTKFCKPLISDTPNFSTNNQRSIRTKAGRNITKINSNNSCSVVIDEVDNHQQEQSFYFDVGQCLQNQDNTTVKGRSKKSKGSRMVDKNKIKSCCSEKISCQLDYIQENNKVGHNSGQSMENINTCDTKKYPIKSIRKIKLPDYHYVTNFNNSTAFERNNSQTCEIAGNRVTRDHFLAKNTDNKIVTTLNGKKNTVPFKPQASQIEEECMTIVTLNDSKHNRRQQFKKINYLKDKMLKILTMKNSSSINDQLRLDTMQASEEASKILNHRDNFTQTSFNNLCCKVIENENDDKGKAAYKKDFSKNKWSKGKWASEFIDHVLAKLKNGIYYNYETLDKYDDGGYKHVSVQTLLTIDRSKIKKIQLAEKQEIDTNIPNQLTNAISISNQASHDTLNTLLSFNNVLANLEVTLNSNQIEVRHPMTDIVVRFDVSLYPEKDTDEDDLLLASPYIPYSTNSQTRFFKSNTMIVNHTLPASICSLIPIMINNILLNKQVDGEQWRIGDQITSPLLTISETSLSEKTLFTMFQNGQYSHVLKKEKKETPGTNCNRLHFGDVIDILRKPHTLFVNEDFSILKKNIRDNGRKCTPVQSIPVLKSNTIAICPLNSCTTLKPCNNYWESWTRSIVECNIQTTSLKDLINHVNIGSFAKSLPQLKIIYSQSDSQFSLSVLISNQNRETIKTDLNKVVSFGNMLDFHSNFIECNEHGTKDSHEKHLVSNNFKRLVKKKTSRPQRKFNTKSSFMESKSAISLNEIKTLKDFFKVLGYKSSLVKVIESHSAKKIMSFVSEMNHWISKITPRQALLILLLANKKGTVNLVRLHSVIVHAIAMNRITNTRELEMEIEVIEKEKLEVNIDNKELPLPETADNENHLMEELCLIAKNAASDVNLPFEDTSEELLHNLVNKRKSLSPSYLRVMARYIGLGLVKIPGKT